MGGSLLLMMVVAVLLPGAPGVPGDPGAPGDPGCPGACTGHVVNVRHGIILTVHAAV